MSGGFFTSDEEVFLTEIRTSRDRIVFHSEDSSTEMQRLTEIEVFDATSGSKKLSWIFDVEVSGERQYLRSIQRKGFDSSASANDAPSEPPYRFQYSGSLPGRMSNAIDHWGYYNAKGGTHPLPDFYRPTTSGAIVYNGVSREANNDFSTHGSLTRIDFPTGGYTEYVLEGHDYAAISGDPTPPTTTIPETDRIYARRTDTSTDRPTESVQFTVGKESLITLNVDVTHRNSSFFYANRDVWRLQQVSGSGSFEEKYLTGYVAPSITDPNSGSPGATKSYTYPAPPGTYELTVTAHFRPSDISPSQPLYNTSVGDYVGATVEYEKEVSVNDLHIQALEAGGVRVAKVIQHDGVDAANDVVTEYRYRLPGDVTRSSGVLVSKPRYAYFMQAPDCSVWTLSSSSFAALGTTQGSHIGYRTVIELHGGAQEDNEYAGSEGTSVYRFTAPDVYIDTDIGGMAGNSFMFPWSRRISNDWKRGKLVSTTRFDADGLPLRRDTTLYRFKTVPGTRSHKRYYGVNFARSTDIKLGLEQSVYYVAWRKYWTVSAWGYPEQKTVTQYPASSSPVTTTTTSQFEDDPASGAFTQLREKQTSGTNAPARFTRYKYAHEEYAGMGPGSGNSHQLSEIYHTTIKSGGGTVLKRSWTRWKQNGTYGWVPLDEWVWTP